MRADHRDAAACLGSAVRQLLTTSVTSATSPGQLRAAENLIREATVLLDAETRPLGQLSPLDEPAAGVRFFNPVIGPGNGMAVPLDIVQDGDGVVAYAKLSQAYEGPPTYLHGGVASMLMDQLLGKASFVVDRWGMTVRLDVNYHGPVPLETALVLRARVTDAKGRRTVATGTIATAADPARVLVQADGVFVTPRQDVASDYFASVVDADGLPSPVRLHWPVS